jgi:hypothetical protein
MRKLIPLALLLFSPPAMACGLPIAAPLGLAPSPCGLPVLPAPVPVLQAEAPLLYYYYPSTHTWTPAPIRHRYRGYLVR